MKVIEIKSMKNPNTGDNIRVSWSINAALQYLNGKEKTMELVQQAARGFLDLFDKMIKDLPDEVCQSCGGVDIYGGEAIINGLHPKCRQNENYKLKDL